MFAALTTLTSLLQNFAADGCAKPTFLGLVPWYQFLDVSVNDTTKRCEINNFNPAQGGAQSNLFDVHSHLFRIVLAITDDLIRVAAYVAVGYIIYGGIQYMTSQGSPDMTKKAQQTIINALIGLGTAIIAASVVTFIGTKLGTTQS